MRRSRAWVHCDITEVQRIGSAACLACRITSSPLQDSACREVNAAEEALLESVAALRAHGNLRARALLCGGANVP